MNIFSGRQLHRWLIPFAAFLFVIGVLAFGLPYSTSLWSAKRTIAGLIYGMCGGWNGNLDNSYCLMVLPIVLYLVWQRWGDLRTAPVQSANSGLAMIAVALLLYWFGMRAANQYFGFLGLQVLVAGMVVWLWGWAVFRIVLFPWAFLGFGWPLPFLDPLIAFPLRMTMSNLAGKILPMMGIPTVQSGTALMSPPDTLHNIALGSRFEIDIADPCSGIRSLFALLMFSALFGYLFLPKMWQQWVIFLSAFPLAILGNLVRVILLVLGSIYFGSAFAIGTADKPSLFHEVAGFLIYAVALGAEFGIAKFLTHDWHRAIPEPEEPPVAA